MSKKLTELQASYDDAECPDCGEAIPDVAVNGDECSNCGHVFYEDEGLEDDYE